MEGAMGKSMPADRQSARLGKFGISTVIGSSTTSLLPSMPTTLAGLQTLNPLRSVEGPRTAASRGLRQAPDVKLSDMPKIEPTQFASYLTEIKSEHDRYIATLTEQQRELKTARQASTSRVTLDDTSLASSPRAPLAQSLKGKEREELPPLSSVPTSFFSEDFELSNPNTFEIVMEANLATAKDAASLQNRLTDYLDVLESHMTVEISERSASFFSALSNLQSLGSQSTVALDRIAALQEEMHRIDKGTAEQGLAIVQTQINRRNAQDLQLAVERVKEVWRALADATELFDQGEWEGALSMITELEDLWRTDDSHDDSPDNVSKRAALDVIPEDEIEPVQPAAASRPAPKIVFARLKALEPVPGRLKALRLSIAQSLQGELIGNLVHEFQQRLKEYTDVDSSEPSAKRTWLSNGFAKKAETSIAMARIYLKDDATMATARQQIIERAKDRARPIVRGLLRCAPEAFEAALSSWQDGLTREVRQLVRKYLPISHENPEDDETFDTSMDRRNGTQDRTAALAVKLREQSHADFLQVLQRTYHALWTCLQIISLHSDALMQLLKEDTAQPRTRPSRQSTQFSMGASSSERFIEQTTDKLADLLRILADLSHVRFSKVLGVRTEKHSHLPLAEFAQVHELTWTFINGSEGLARHMLAGLRSVIGTQSRAFLQQYHNTRTAESAKVVENEQWSAVDVSGEAQHHVDLVLSSATEQPAELLLGSARAARDPTRNAAIGPGGKQLIIEGRSFHAVAASLKCLEVLVDYLRIVVNLSQLTTECMSRIIEFLKQFNSRTCQVVLGAGAMRSAGLKNITAKHLALASQALSINISLIPYVRENVRRYLTPKQTVMLVEFDKLKRDYQEHQSEIHLKLVAIMGDRLAVHCKSLMEVDWEKESNSPNAYMESLIKESATLHKVLSRYLESTTLEDIMMQVFSAIHNRLADEFGRIPLKSQIAKDRLLADATYLRVRWSELKGLQRATPGEELERLVGSKPIVVDAPPAAPTPTPAPTLAPTPSFPTYQRRVSTPRTATPTSANFRGSSEAQVKPSTVPEASTAATNTEPKEASSDKEAGVVQAPVNTHPATRPPSGSLVSQLSTSAAPSAINVKNRLAGLFSRPMTRSSSREGDQPRRSSEMRRGASSPQSIAAVPLAPTTIAAPTMSARPSVDQDRIDSPLPDLPASPVKPSTAAVDMHATVAILTEETAEERPAAAADVAPPTDQHLDAVTSPAALQSLEQPESEAGSASATISISSNAIPPAGDVLPDTQIQPTETAAAFEETVEAVGETQEHYLDTSTDVQAEADALLAENARSSAEPVDLLARPLVDLESTGINPAAVSLPAPIAESDTLAGNSDTPTRALSLSLASIESEPSLRTHSLSPARAQLGRQRIGGVRTRSESSSPPYPESPRSSGPQQKRRRLVVAHDMRPPSMSSTHSAASEEVLPAEEPATNGSRRHEPAANGSSNGARPNGMPSFSNGSHNGHPEPGDILPIPPSALTASSDFEPLRAGSQIDRSEYVRLLLQALQDSGYTNAAQALAEESGYDMESPTVTNFRAAVLSGSWDQVERSLAPYRSDDSTSAKAIRFIVSEQKYLEMLEARETKSALSVLRNELAPLNYAPERIHVLSSLMMCSDPAELRQRASWDGAASSSRRLALERLQAYIPPSTMLPQRRLEQLIGQATQHQIDHCLYHCIEDRPSLYADHHCDHSVFPDVTVHTLSDHRDEVWCLSFSHNGKYLATGSLDKTAIIWSITENYEFVVHKILPDFEEGVSCLSWSPDDSILLASAEEFIYVWNVKLGELISTHKTHDHTVNAIEWLPDGTGYISAGMDAKVLFWDLSGNPSHTWQTGQSRIVDAAISPDGKRLVCIGSADLPLTEPATASGSTPSASTSMRSERRIHIYNISERRQEKVLSVNADLTCVSISADSRYALINQVPNEIGLFDLEEARLVQRYVGQQQGRHIIRSCFGGPRNNLIISGSENGKIVIWDRRTAARIEVLSGHGPGSVNAVAWHPLNKDIFASVSDDGTCRIWMSQIQASSLIAGSYEAAQLNVEIRVSNGQGLIFDLQDFRYVRDDLRICGLLTGTLPQLSQQNVFLGLPVQLMPEEVVWLVSNGHAVLIDDLKAHREPTTGQIEQYRAERMARAKAEAEEHAKMEQARSAKAREVFADKIAAKQEQRLAKKALAKPLLDFEDEPVAVKPVERTAETLVIKEDAYAIVIEPTSHNRPGYDARGHTYKTIESAKQAGLWHYPSSEMQRARCAVFADLHQQGYFMGPAPKFGADFLVYPGDPLRFHSHFNAVVLSSPQHPIRPLELVSWGRLATGVKKAALMCTYDQTTDRVSYLSLEWAGMG
ncbi:uncharacterized protein L969DRAFT_46235 [Mixia osmundae IAM 14324]|uniref:tRNA-intron lyase n=1 Tax=Mixia osmundae (strain CBS 9802 / IAM 14324 / JCM 22182 / KY 12970) TaxID=764103 RepID=G7DU86_MIXOS|nr:uncharacterized protein L969DRAFT_46235 [Mixia osmundae IAM 14324]KEI41015.1 hypothetical protein L969DRAFT_46235 [Mixia osmundae IAM 14324]GAA94146.1 hypothetical protein E5Q_00794 [Mixia osmundae IAM 14324]